MKLFWATLLILLLLSGAAPAGNDQKNPLVFTTSPVAPEKAEKNVYDTGLDRIYANLGKEIWLGDLTQGTNLQDAIKAIEKNNVILRMPAGNYILGADLVIPPNVTLKPERGAIISSASRTLTLAGGLEAGPYQIFNFTGAAQVVIRGGAVKEIIPQWWGADTSASAAANAAAIQASLNAITGDFQYWRLPLGSYSVDSGLIFDGSKVKGGFFLNIILNIDGQLLFNNSDGLWLKGLQFAQVNINQLRADKMRWDSHYYGIKVDNVHRSTIRVNRVASFAKGLYLMANDGHGLYYNNFYFGELYDNKFGIYIHQSHKDSRVNDNSFYGGRIALGLKTHPVTSGSWGVYYEYPYGLSDSMRFYSVSFEHLHNGVHGGVTGGSLCYSTFYTVRFENVDANWFQNMGDGITWIKGAENLTPDFLANKLSNLGKGAWSFTIIGNRSADDKSLRSIAVDELYGGLSWFNWRDPTRLSHLNKVPNGFKLTDGISPDYAQMLDKEFTDSGPPAITGNTFNQNAVVWNTTVESGHPLGWVCKTSGTCGSLSHRRTGSIIPGTKSIKVNNAADLKRGQIIRLDNGAGGIDSFTIDYVSNLTVNILQTSSRVHLNSILSWVNPTWQAMPNYP